MKIRGSAYRAGDGVKEFSVFSFRFSVFLRSILALLAGIFMMAAACSPLPPLPEQVELESYTPIDYPELLTPRISKLQPGQKIKVPAFFWQYLTYDPAMIRNYGHLLQQPRKWSKLEWFATYGTRDMQGYFDLAALDPALVRDYQPRRLDHIMIYGEMAALGPGLYLRVHRVERIEED